MSRLSYPGRDINTSASFWLAGIIYLFIIFVILSPRMTPAFFLRVDSFVIGPEGLLRLDILILPVLLVFAILYNIYTDGYRVRLVNNDISLTFFLVFLLMIVSVSVGLLYRGYPFRFADYYAIGIWLIVSLCIALVPQLVSVSTAKRALVIMIVASTLSALFAVMQSFQIDIINDNLTPYFTTRNVGRRATGTASNPNFFAQMMIIPFFTVAALLLREVMVNRNKRLGIISQITLTIALLVIFYSIYITFSRTVLVGVVVGLLAMTSLLFIFEVGAPSSRVRLISLVFLSMVGVLLLTIILNINLDRYAELADITASSSFRTRVGRWRIAATVIAEAIVIGHGPSINGLEQSALGAGQSLTPIDSGLLRWWYHYGAVGVLLMGFLLTFTARFNISNITRGNLKKNDPLLWAGNLGLFGFCCSFIIVWSTMPFNTNRRAFMLFIILLIIIIGGNLNIDDGKY